MKPAVIDIPAIVQDVISGQVKSWPKFGEEGEVDRKQYLSASETLKCIRSLFMEKTVPEDYDKDTKEGGWGYAERGNSAEDWLVKVLRQFFGPAELQFEGDNQRSFVWGRMSVTPDGLLMMDGDEIIYLEVKSIDPRARLGGSARPGHEAQVKQGMGILKHLGIKVSYAVIVYLDANNYENMQQFVVRPDPSFFRQQVAKAEKLFGLVETATPDNWLAVASTLPAEGITNGSKDCDYCPFVTECSVMHKSGKTPTVVVTDDVAPPQMPTFAPKSVVRMVSRYVDLKSELDLLKDQVEGLSAEIKIHMQDNDLSTLDAGKYVAEMQKVAGRKTMDKAALEADGIDLSKYEKVGKPSLRLTVKETDSK